HDPARRGYNRRVAYASWHPSGNRAVKVFTQFSHKPATIRKLLQNMNRPVEDPSLYINREASWLAFNRRVLEEANDEHNPLLERVKFLAISASNLDEFFEVRVAGLLQRIEEGFVDSGPDALTAQQERDLISRETHEFVQEQYECWNRKLLPALARENIR